MSDIKAGDTVRHREFGDDEFVVKIAEPDPRGLVVVTRSDGGYVPLFLSLLVKVEPTPADVHIMFNADGNGRTLNPRVTDFATHVAECDERLGGGPYRVARFTFAEWVES